MSSEPKTLVDEKLALSLFLDSLLRETDEVVEAEVITDVEIASIAEVAEETITAAEVEAKVDVKVEMPIPAAPIVDKISKPELEEEPRVDTAIQPTIPEWANQPFQILLFEVAGLKLAVPLVELSAVIKWKDSVTEMPGSEDFYMGILQHLNYRVAVIDTAKMVLPTNKQNELIDDDPRERVKHIVLIDDYRWGLACDKIGEVITLQAEEVRWRSSDSKRKWLAGTVIGHMCALLNSEAFAVMLKEGQSAEELA